MHERDIPPSNAIFQAESFQKPFNPNAPQLERDHVRCDRIGTGEVVELTNKNLILKDKLNKNDAYFDHINGQCVQDYLSLVRNRIETKFGEAFAAVNEFCTDEKRNRPRKSTGNAHLRLINGKSLLS